MRTRIGRWGNSLALRIPAAFAADAELIAGTSVELSVEDGHLRVTPVRDTLHLTDLVASITDENRHNETDWGPAAGGEVW